MTFADAALLISAKSRPHYLAQVLETWDAVPELGQLDHVTFALGRSPYEDEQVEVVRAFAERAGVPVRVRWDSTAAVVSPGMHRALGEAIDAEFAGSPELEFLICSEEDVSVSSDVLAYMGWARHKFASHPEVLTVSAHNALGQGWHKNPPDDDSGADQEAVRLHPQFHPWCWATWRKRWEVFLKPDWDWDATTGDAGHTHGYDWQICRIMARHGLQAVTPDASRSQNIGQVGGVYANPASFPQTQAASFRYWRKNPSYRYEEA